MTTTKNGVLNAYDSSDIYLQGEYDSFSYNRPMGAFKPRFAGVPQDYFPASACDIILMILFVVITVLGGLGLVIGFLYWEMARGMSEFVLVWAIVWAVFTVLMFVGIYLGGRARIKSERVMIQKKLADEKKRLEEDKKMIKQR